MDLMTRCERCGKLVETDKLCMGVWGDSPAVPAVTIGTLDIEGVFRKMKDASAPLCPDCLGEFRAWLADDEAALPSVVSSSAKRLIGDMCNMIFTGGNYASVCEYFGHRTGSCEGCDMQGVGDRTTCLREVRADIKRRCEGLGIDLEEDDDGKR